MRAMHPTIFLLFALPALADAQSGVEEARAEFVAGQRAYEAGRFDEAVARFERSFELTAEPDILFNIANAYDRLRRDREALDAYRRYLELSPDTEDRAQIEARMAILARSVPSEPAAPEPAVLVTEREPAQPLRLSSPPAREPNVGAWTLVGAGAAAAIAGVVLLALAQSDMDAIAGATRWEDIQESYERVPIVSGSGFALLGVGIAATATGAVWLVVGGSM